MLFVSAIGLSFVTQKAVNGDKVTTPPGTVLLKPGLYIDAYEISVSNWKDFAEGWLLGRENDTATYAAMLPDSLV